MRKNRFTAAQLITILKEAGGGAKVDALSPRLH
jgi:hypothetical protein